jgi:hypothetical protein
VDRPAAREGFLRAVVERRAVGVLEAVKVAQGLCPGAVVGRRAAGLLEVPLVKVARADASGAAAQRVLVETPPDLA